MFCLLCRCAYGGHVHPLKELKWPTPLEENAFHGITGEVVRTIEPHTESDPAALLAQSLVAAGTVIGRNPHFLVEGDRHFGNLFAVIVGNSSKGRKYERDFEEWQYAKRSFCPAIADAKAGIDEPLAGMPSSVQPFTAITFRDFLQEHVAGPDCGDKDYCFTKGHLDFITVTLCMSSVEEQVGFLQEKYGKPTASDSREMRNAMGGVWTDQL